VKNIGAKRMALLCVELERCGQSDNLELAQPLLTQLTQQLERVRALLDAERNRF
jgi:HPt (histidine-containing phosphotransfer) domain-containing protein